MGQPDSVSTNRDTSYGYPVRIYATWNSKTDGRRAGHTVDLQYIVKTGQIINKDYN